MMSVRAAFLGLGVSEQSVGVFHDKRTLRNSQFEHLFASGEFDPG